MFVFGIDVLRCFTDYKKYVVTNTHTYLNVLENPKGALFLVWSNLSESAASVESEPDESSKSSRYT